MIGISAVVRRSHVNLSRAACVLARVPCLAIRRTHCLENSLPPPCPGVFPSALGEVRLASGLLFQPPPTCVLDENSHNQAFREYSLGFRPSLVYCEVTLILGARRVPFGTRNCSCTLNLTVCPPIIMVQALSLRFQALLPSSLSHTVNPVVPHL